MGAPFHDIALYAPTLYKPGTPEYWEEKSLYNYISDLYIICMHGYKPPNTTRVCIEPSYYNIWNRTWKNGSLKTIAVYFDYESFLSLRVNDKYTYVLNTIQEAMLKLSEEYNWDKNVFEKAYVEIINNDFRFKIAYPAKMSKDKRKIANISVEKTQTTTMVNICLNKDGHTSVIKLFDKRNWWVFDSAYILVKNNKWFDNDRFGLSYKPLEWKGWYSIKENKVYFELNNIKSEYANLDKIFKF